MVKEAQSQWSQDAAEREPDFRMYRDEYPQIDDLVMAEITRIEDTGVYLKLFEYENLEGLMMLSEVSKRRWRTVSKMIQVRRREVVMVMRVDREKRYVDLSKKRVPLAEKERFMERYKNSRRVHSIFRQTAGLSGVSLEELYRSFGWKLYDDFSHAIDGTPQQFYKTYDVPENAKNVLETIVSRRLTKKSRKVYAVFEINCFTFEGINSIIAALEEGEKLSTEEIPLQIRLISSPRYSISTITKVPEAAIESIKKALEAVEKKIKELKGHFIVTENAVLVEEEESEEQEESESEE